MTAATEAFPGLRDQGDLAALVEGLTDTEITRLVEAAGVEPTLDRLFSLMVKAFDPEQAAGHSAIAQWEVSAGGESHTYHLSVDAGTCRVGAGAVPSPRITLAQEVCDFVRLMAGQIDAVNAVMAGRIKLSGDVMFGLTLEGFFRRD